MEGMWGDRWTGLFHAWRKTCQLCGEPLPAQPHQGQARRWCSEACRLRAFRARQRRESP